MARECIITSDFEGDPPLTKYVSLLQSEIKLFVPEYSPPRLSGRVTIVRPFYENEIVVSVALASIKTGWRILEQLTHHDAEVIQTLSFFKKGETDVAYLAVRLPDHYLLLIKALREVIGGVGEFVPPAYTPKWEPHIPIAKGIGLAEKLRNLPKKPPKPLTFVVSNNKPKLEARGPNDQKWEEIKLE